MEAKTYSVTRENRPGIHVTGFPEQGNGRPFISFKVGDGFGGEFAMILYLADARALACTLGNAINYADQSATVAAARLEDVS